VPPLARVLLLDPPVTHAPDARRRGRRDPRIAERARASFAERVRQWVVVTALISFVAFAACWHVLDGGF